MREDDLEIAISAITGALADDPRILKTPPPSVKVASVADNAAMLIIWAWANPEDFQNVVADEYARLLKRLNEAELQIV